MEKSEEKPVWKEKYEKLAVTPKELCLRQQGKCWLELAFDNFGDHFEFGTLYCTDGKDYAETAAMLNPTNECIICLVSLVRKIVEETGYSINDS